MLSILDQASSLGVPTIGNEFLFAKIELLSSSSIRVWYTRAPLLGTNKANDSHSYSISGPQTTTIKLATSTTSNTKAIDLYFDKDLIEGQWTLNFVTANIISDDLEGASLPSNTSCIFDIRLANKPSEGLETDLNLTRKFLNPAFLKDSQKNWRSLETTLEQNRANLASTVTKIADQLYLSTASSKYLQTRASNVGITHNPILGLTDDIYRNLTISLLNEKLTRTAKSDLLEILYGADAVRANITSLNYEPYRLFDKASLNILIDSKYTIPVIFNWSDFNNALFATAQEVSFVINKYFDIFNIKAFAVPYTDIETGRTFIKLYSGSTGLRSSISIISGTSQTALGFDTVLNNQIGPSLNPYQNITIIKSTLGKATIRINKYDDEITETLDHLQISDYVNIIGSEFSIYNRGSFVIEGILHSGTDYTDLTITNPSAVNESVSLLTTQGFVIYRPLKKQVYDNFNYAYVTNNNYTAQTNQTGYAKASIPVDTNIINRNYANAAYLPSNPDTWFSSFYRRPDGLVTINSSTIPSNTKVEISDFIAKIPEYTDFLTSAGTSGVSDKSLFSHITFDTTNELVTPIVLATLDNKVVVIGGRSLPSTDSNKISVCSITQNIDTELNLNFNYSWVNTAFAGSILGLGMSAVVLDYPRFYNKILIAGGYTNGPEATVGSSFVSLNSFIYSPSTQSLTSITGTTPYKIADAALCWVKSANLAVLVGGVDTTGYATANVSTWDPSYSTDNALGYWYQGPSSQLIKPRTNCQAVEIGTNKVLVIGGRVNNNTNTFTLANMGLVLNSCEIITADVNFATPPVLASPMAYARFAFGMTKLPDNRVLVVGGIGKNPSVPVNLTGNQVNHELKSCEIYDPITGIWSNIPDMLEAHSYCSCYYDSITNRVYVFGGCLSTAVEYLNLEDMTWHYSTAKLDFISFRAGSAGITLDNTSVITRIGSTYIPSESNSTTRFLATYNETARSRVNGVSNLYNSDSLVWTKNQNGTTFNVNLIDAQDYNLGYSDANSYILDTSALYGIGENEITISTEIPRGQGCPAITITESLASFNKDGYLIVSFGNSNQVGPVKYFITDDHTINLDPSFNFNNEYYAGTILTLVTQTAPYLPSIQEQKGLLYLTASNAGLEAAQKYLNDISAAGIDAEIEIRYPSDRGLGNEGAPVKNNYKLSDIIEIFGPDTLDTFLEKARSNE